MLSLRCLVQVKILNVLFNPKLSLILITILQAYAYDILTWSPSMTGRLDPLEGQADFFLLHYFFTARPTKKLSRINYNITCVSIYVIYIWPPNMQAITAYSLRARKTS